MKNPINRALMMRLRRKRLEVSKKSLPVRPFQILLRMIENP